jgi:uncharacterized protein (TIGR02466 family)
MLENVTPFPPLVFKLHYDGFDQQKLVPICEGLVRAAQAKRNSYLESGDAQSSVIAQDSAPHKLAVFKPFYDWLWPHMETVLIQHWGLSHRIKYWINDSWVNRHGRGGKTLPHTHGASSMASAAYITHPEGSGHIEFRDPCETQWAFHYREFEPGGWWTIPVKQGDVLLFPGWLEHRTEASDADTDRWVLTTNILNHHQTASSKYHHASTRTGPVGHP